MAGEVGGAGERQGGPASRAGTEAELGEAQATVVSSVTLTPLSLNHGFSFPIAGIWLQQSRLSNIHN